MQKLLAFLSVLTVCLLGTNQVLADSVFLYNSPPVQHPGKNIPPTEAYNLIQKSPQSTFLVDVRTRAEYQFVGHPVGAYLVPYKFLSDTFEGKEYKLKENPEFGRNILARFNPQTDTLVFMCRSGTRSAMALNAAVKAGWPADKAYSMMGGFEGGRLKNYNSSFNGQRLGGSWQNEGLPWTYSMDPKRVY